MHIPETTARTRVRGCLLTKAECVHRLREAMIEGRFDPASADFRCVQRVLQRSARNKWKPTPPQVQNMQQIIAKLDEDESLIDWGDVGYEQA